jgi:hypothetical protein
LVNASAGYKLMKMLGVDDLTKRISPRLDKFHSIDPTGNQKGVTYWRKTYLYQGTTSKTSSHEKSPPRCYMIPKKDSLG